MKTNKRKLLSMLLVVALIAVIAIGGMLAYLTDRDSEANVFTVGDVKIDLTEEFETGATLIPGVDIEKEVNVVNTGKNDAWVWVEIAIPAKLDGGQDASKNVVHFNYPKGAVGAEANQWTWLMNDKDYVIGTTEKNGIQYNIYTVLYNSALAKGETTEFAAMNKVYMDTHVDIDPEGNWAWVDAGNVTDLKWNSNKEGNPVIYVSAYAIQKENFADVKAGYTAYQTQWGTNGSEYENYALVKNEDEFAAAIEKGGIIYLGNDIELTKEIKVNKDTTINLNGYDLNADLTDSLDNKYDRIFYVSGGAKVDFIGEGDVNIADGVGRWIWCFGGAYPENGVAADGTTINIYGGNWVQHTDDFNANSDPHYCEGMYANRAGNINIYGGTFDFGTVPYYTLNESRNGQIVVYGGTFINFDPSKSAAGDGSYVAPGYKVVSETQANGDIWYTVVAE